MLKAAVGILMLMLASGCASWREAACGGQFPSCDRDAPRPSCEALIPADSTVYITDPKDLEGIVSSESLAEFAGSEGLPGSFAAKAAEADAVWFYDNSGRIDGGMMVGTEGLLALKGCIAIAQMVTVIYN
jgi:hypothetical protein